MVTAIGDDGILRKVSASDGDAIVPVTATTAIGVCDRCCSPRIHRQALKMTNDKPRLLKVMTSGIVVHSVCACAVG